MKRSAIMILGCLLTGALVGCTEAEPALPDTPQAPASTATPVPLVIPESVAAALADNKPTHEEEGDLTWNQADEQTVVLADGASQGGNAKVDGDTVTITQPGDYRVKGVLSDGQLVVDVEAKGIVRLILDGVSITNSTSSAMLLKSADKAVIWLAEGSQNTLIDAKAYVYPDESTTEPDAALFSRVDLTIAGAGSLEVTGQAGDAITGKDGLVLASGTLKVTAADDGIKGRDYLIVRDGQISVTAGGDALKSTNDSDEAAGYLLVSGGQVTATAKIDCVDAVTDALITGGQLHLTCTDDGIHADRVLMVEDGDINIAQSYEGLESAAIILAGGTINITASDDGINASNGTGSEEGFGGWGGGDPENQEWDPDAGPEWDGTGDGTDPQAMPTTRGRGTGHGGGGRGMGGGEAAQDAALVIKGGKISITAGGDGLDSNGTATMTGGEVIIDVPNRGMEGPIDVIGEWSFTGGSIVDASGNPIK